jgi:DNA-binding NtrC family response regulator
MTAPLPIRPRAAEYSPRVAVSAPRCLLIDDEHNFRTFLGEALEDAGYQVRHAATARAGLALARESAFDIILLDQNLPDGSGLDLIPELRLLPTNPTVVVVTAYGEFEQAVQSIKTGAFHYLSKPFGFPELLEVMKSAALSRGEPHQREIDGLASLVGQDPCMLEIKRLVVRIARAPVEAVLVLGESGTGKELVAQAIHELSTRAAHRLVAVNCAALSDSLLMDELFGHERGAFTDARNRKPGVFELADRGTLFLDEISEMGPRAQAALLRVLEERRVRRVGGTEEIAVDVRVIAASNRDLDAEIAAGRFRADLYYRLNVVQLVMPPLRERASDIPALATLFSHQTAARYPQHARTVRAEAMARLLAYPWPGNVRELRNAIERAYLVGDGPEIGVADLPHTVAEGIAPPGSADFATPARPIAAIPRSGVPGTAPSFQEIKREYVDRFERAYLEAALVRAEGNITQAAEEAGVLRQVFQRMLLRHGLTADQYRR